MIIVDGHSSHCIAAHCVIHFMCSVSARAHVYLCTVHSISSFQRAFEALQPFAFKLVNRIDLIYFIFIFSIQTLEQKDFHLYTLNIEAHTFANGTIQTIFTTSEFRKFLFSLSFINKLGIFLFKSKCQHEKFLVEFFSSLHFTLLYYTFVVFLQKKRKKRIQLQLHGLNFNYFLSICFNLNSSSQSELMGDKLC